MAHAWRRTDQNNSNQCRAIARASIKRSHHRKSGMTGADASGTSGSIGAPARSAALNSPFTLTLSDRRCSRLTSAMTSLRCSSGHADPGSSENRICGAHAASQQPCARTVAGIRKRRLWLTLSAVPRPSVCSLPHRRHFSQPIQSITAEMLRKCARSSSCGIDTAHHMRCSASAHASAESHAQQHAARALWRGPSSPCHRCASSNGTGHAARSAGESTSSRTCAAVMASSLRRRSSAAVSTRAGVPSPAGALARTRASRCGSPRRAGSPPP